MTLTAAGQKTGRFSVAERRQRLADLPPKFLAHDAHAAEAPQARFGEQLNHEVDVWQEEVMTPAELGPQSIRVIGRRRADEAVDDVFLKKRRARRSSRKASCGASSSCPGPRSQCDGSVATGRRALSSARKSVLQSPVPTPSTG